MSALTTSGSARLKRISGEHYVRYRQAPKTEQKMPTIGWLEGLLTLLDTPFPFNNDDPRKFGFQLGQQVIALYTIEIVLKYELDKLGLPQVAHHNLRVLFLKLPIGQRSSVEKKYSEILANRVDRTFDIARSARSLLSYLGSEPLTNTRYFWESGRTHLADHASILMMPDILSHLLYSLLIVLHDYPCSSLPRHFNTKFVKLKQALDEKRQSDRSQRSKRRDANWKPNVVWMEGVLALLTAKFPHDNEDRRKIGFGVGRQIIGLYLVEIILKCAVDDHRVVRRSRHDLLKLFENLSPEQKSNSEGMYRTLLNSNTEWTWDIAESVESLLTYMGKTAFTDTRYFWDSKRTHVVRHASILMMPETVVNLVYALFVSLHRYPTKPIIRQFDTAFRSLEQSLKENRETSEVE